MARNDRFQQFEFADNTPERKWRVPWRWLLLLLVLGAAGTYVYVFEQARIEKMLKGTPLERPPTVTQAYKWRDAQGNWNITDTPPPAGTEYETLRTGSDTNIVPALPTE